MATRQKTWNPGDTLTAADLNGEFNEIYTNITNANVASGANISAQKININTTDFISGQDSLEINCAWSTWAPTITTQAGTYTSAPSVGQSSKFRYMVIGKLAVFNCSERFNISGSSASYIDITLPSGVTIPRFLQGDEQTPMVLGVGYGFDGGSAPGRHGPIRISHGEVDGDSYTSIRLIRMGDWGAEEDWSVNNGSFFRFSALTEID